METGTQILIERMRTNPEEFVEGMGSKWARAMALGNDCLPEEDKRAIREAFARAKIATFNEEVLKALAGENEPVSTLRYQAEGRYAGGFTDPRGLFGNAPTTLTVSGSS